jgi:sporulation protein YlmC with PRC-barrel domain
MQNQTTQATSERTLLSVTDEAITVADTSEDVRGHAVVDRNGEDIGKVDDLLVDDGGRKVRFLQIKEGGFLGIGGRTFLIPVDAVARIEDDTVHVDQTGEHVGAGPTYDPVIASDDAWRNEAYREGGYYEGLYGHYGYAPFWAPGYAYPGYPFYR